MRIVAIINQKGGTGKTTTAVNLGAALAERDVRVLLVDLDAQLSATRWLAAAVDGVGLYEVLTAAPNAPLDGRNLPAPMREVNRAHAKVRAISARAIATVKTWKLLAKLHCCPRRATALLAAILVLQLVEEQHQPS